MSQTTLTLALATEYRAVVECAEDPCRYCRTPRSRHADKETYDNFDDALKSGRKLASHVYGASTHIVEVQTRDASPWTAVGTAALRG